MITFIVNSLTDKIYNMINSLNNMKISYQIVSLSDDGFLPQHITSPYQYFLSNCITEQPAEKRLHYNCLNIPEFWSIRVDGLNGAVYSMGHKKAEIYFTEPIENRNVHHVEWFTENNRVYKVDFYNKYGQKWKCEFFGQDGSIETVSYYAKQQEIIVEYPCNQVFTLLDKGKTTGFFSSFDDFFLYYMKEANIKSEDCFYVVQQPEELQSNLFKRLLPLIKRVVFFDPATRYRFNTEFDRDGIMFYSLPDAPYKSDFHNEALILTASDQLESINELTSCLPDTIFHIGANTQVSDKLLKLGEKPNVNIYPQISPEKRQELWQRCAFYLDINHYREIYDALNCAQKNNLLIIGFEDTLHNSELVLEECVIPSDNVESMIELIDVLSKNNEYYLHLVQAQYRRVLEFMDYANQVEGR